jgi:hypothetical protein
LSRRLTQRDRTIIVELYKNGVPPVEIAKQFKISSTYVHQLVNRDRKFGSAFRRRLAAKIRTLLVGIDPAERKKVIDAVA